MTHPFDSDESAMRRALDLAVRGEGFVEPNPMVGAVVVDHERRGIGEGFHERFGGPHAEVNALRQAGAAADGATLFVTLEPCSHHGKTGPCVDAVIQAGIGRVVMGTEDPNPRVAGEGIAKLRAAGIAVEVGTLRDDCELLIAPFAKWITTGMPWVHAKWAMTLDGRIATRTGHSQWITNAASRERVHRLRGRMDAILVGADTAAHDDPQLTARPPGPRSATRVVVSRSGRLNPQSKLAQTANEVPTLVTVLDRVDVASAAELESLGVEIVRLSADPTDPRFPDLSRFLRLLGGQNAAHVLVEGGGMLLGRFFDAGLIDELHVFVAPKLCGGSDAVAALKCLGRKTIPEPPDLIDPKVEFLDGDVYIHGRVAKPRPPD